MEKGKERKDGMSDDCYDVCMSAYKGNGLASCRLTYFSQIPVMIAFLTAYSPLVLRLANSLLITQLRRPLE